jgi:glucose-1-phosphate adenylyltransferase
VFKGYWEDIGTVRAFFEANLALAQPLPPFNFFDPRDPIYTQDRYLPPSKINNCTIDYVVFGDGAIVEGSSVKHSVIGIRSFIREGSKLEDVVMMGADTYETEEELKANETQGIPHIGVGRNCQIKGAIIDKNARIGDNVTLTIEGKADGTYPHGIIVRDGVLLVPKGGIVPKGSVV